MFLRRKVVDPVDARLFLEKQFVPEAGMTRYATHVHPDNVTIYIANDNVLAVHAPEIIGSPIARVVNDSLRKYGDKVYDNHASVLLGRIIPEMFYDTKKVLLGHIHSNKFTADFMPVLEENDCRRPFINWTAYPDLVDYKVLNEILLGRIWLAEKYFDLLTNM